MRSRRLLAVALAVASAAIPLRAQENGELGRMWTFENPPLEYLKAVYGFSPSQAWLDTTRLASIRFGNGCSSSFVSANGLILTNHHCVRDYVAKVSPKDQDWVRDGFVAGSMAAEVPVPGLTVQQLVSMTDVTARMNEGVGEDDAPAQVDKKRQANQDAIVAEAQKKEPKLKPQVVKLYQGAMFQLYMYRVYDDIRLCMAPHLQTAHFGGDPDNFTYPRYSIDFSLCRAYENGRPADTSANHFTWSAAGPRENELVFVTGNPGTTERSRTVSQVEFQRDVQIPIRLEQIDHRIEILERHAAKGPAEEKAVRTEILGLQNSQKAFRGFLAGAKDVALMEQKRKAEEAFRGRVKGDAEAQRRFGDVWEKLEQISRDKREMEPLVRFQTSQGWKMLQVAVHVVRATDPETPEERQAMSRKTALELDPKDAAYEYEAYADHLERARKWLKQDDAFRSQLAGERASAAGLMELEKKSRLGDKAYVRTLLDGGKAEVDAAKDPLLDAARALVPLLKKNEPRLLKLTAEENVHSSRVGQALFAVYGQKISPDATFTLRLADGVVKGYPCNGTIAPWRTTFHGMYARNCEFDGHHPFDLPWAWLARQARVDMTKAVNFVSTNDIVGGNSGSPIINARQEVVGVVFDGNIESLANRYVFRDDIPRTVSVHSDAIIEALIKIYDAAWLADELMGRRGS